jgi:ABC-2 type transport system ATP-binding protein
MELLSVSDLHCCYGDRLAVKGVNFRLTRGHIMGLLGPNGAGKTTTMEAICGLRRPERGHILLNQLDISTAGLTSRAAIGYLPEHPPLYPELTVSEYLQFCARLYPDMRRKALAAVRETIELCDLGDVSKRLIRGLSKGFQQRVGIAQAILHKPDLIVLDEPTVGLDPNQVHNFRSLVRRLGREYGVLLSTHILSEVEATCDKVVVLHEGQVVLDTTVGHAPDDHAGDLVVTWASAPAVTQINLLEGVNHSEVIDHHALRVTCADLDLATQSILQASLTNHWQVREIARGRGALEATFLALTRGELSPANAPDRHSLPGQSEPKS